MNDIFRKVRIALLAGAIVVVANKVRADIVVSEAFNYGPTSGALVGQNGGAGFSGAWNQGNSGITYSSAGLTFSNLSVSGGMATSTGNNGIGNALSFRPSASTLTGTFYGSFLTQVVSANSSVEIGIDLGASDTFPFDEGFGILSPSNGSALGVSTGGPGSSSGSSLNLGQTYLTLFKIDTVTGSLQAWLMSASQFDQLKLGGITEAELNGATLGTSADQLWARASVTGFGAIAVSNLNLFQNAASGVSATLAQDEFRLSNTSLDEAVPVVVPEPGSVTLIVAGISLLALARRRAQ